MERADIEHINNIVKIAAAKGTKDEPFIKDGIDSMLSSGVAQIQSKMIMLEAFKVESTNNKPFIKQVVKRYNKLCKLLGYK